MLAAERGAACPEINWEGFRGEVGHVGVPILNFVWKFLRIIETVSKGIFEVMLLVMVLML